MRYARSLLMVKLLVAGATPGLPARDPAVGGRTSSSPATRPLSLCHGGIFFFFNDTAPPEIYPLSLHDALPILARLGSQCRLCLRTETEGSGKPQVEAHSIWAGAKVDRNLCVGLTGTIGGALRSRIEVIRIDAIQEVGSNRAILKGWTIVRHSVIVVVHPGRNAVGPAGIYLHDRTGRDQEGQGNRSQQRHLAARHIAGPPIIRGGAVWIGNAAGVGIRPIRRIEARDADAFWRIGRIPTPDRKST